MQVTKEQIQRQQEILSVLGFYHGKFDGIWGPKTIEAKKRYEGDAKFVPGIPNNGLPFGDRGPFPALISINHATGLLEHPALAEHAKKFAATSTEEDEGAGDTTYSLGE